MAKTTYKQDFWQLVEAVVEHAGGGCSFNDLLGDDEIHVGDVIELLRENAPEFERCDQKRRAAKAEVERLRDDLAAAYRALADYQRDIDQGFLPGSRAADHKMTVRAAQTFVATGALGPVPTEPGAPLLNRI